MSENIQVTTVGDNYVLRLYDYNIDDVSFCRSLQGARYHRKNNCWTAARSVPNAIELQAAEIFKDEETLELRKAVKRHLKLVKDFTWSFKENITFYEHQKDWREWCRNIPRGMCSAEMGLGKTLMSMLWWAEHGILPRNIIVICPISLIKNWINEIAMYTGEQAHAVIGTKTQKEKALRERGIHVINYESFVSMSDRISGELSKSCVVLDESHKIKNPSTDRCKAIDRYCNDQARTHVLCLTGTPISQGAQDYYGQFRVINKVLLGPTYTSFKHRYCITEQIRGAPLGVQKITGYKKLEELTNLVKPYCRTYLKKDCLDLPPKSYITRFVELSPEQRSAYNELKHEMALWIETSAEPLTVQNVLTKLLRLSQIVQGYLPQDKGYHYFAKNPKRDCLAELIDELPPQEPFVVICRFLPDILAVEEIFTAAKIKYGKIQGDVPAEQRQNIVSAFQAGEIRAIVGQVATAGIGFNITRASNMIFYSNSYSLTDRLQAEDRIHRIGTKGTCVYTDIVAADSVDEQVIRALRSKNDLASCLTELRKHLNN